MTARGAALGLALALGAEAAAAKGTCGDWQGGGDAAHVAACDREIAAAEDPGVRAELLRDRGYAFELMGDLDAAQADYEAAVALSPRSSAALTDLAWLLQARGDAAGALALAERAYAISPTDPYVVQRLAWSLWEFERFGECLERADAALASAPGDYALHSVRGSCLGGLDRPAEALASLDRALSLGEDPAWVGENRAAQLLALGRAEEAATAARASLGLDPSRAFALMMLIDAEVAGGHMGQAVAAYEEFAPGIGDAALDQQGVRNDLAWALVMAGDGARALPIMEAWAADHPVPTADDLDEVDTLGHVLAAAGEPDLAARALAHAARFGGPERQAYYRERLAGLGISVGLGSAGLKAGLRECAGHGPACVLWDE